MKVRLILNSDVPNLGEEGDICEVTAGYARNCLIPRGLALAHTQNNLSVIYDRRKAIELRKQQKREHAQDLKQRLEETPLDIRVRSGSKGRLYGAVTTAMIVEELARQSVIVERRNIEISGGTIKDVGTHKVALHLYEGVTVTLTVEVRPEGGAVARSQMTPADNPTEN